MNQIGSKSGKAICLVVCFVVALGLINTVFLAPIQENFESFAFSALLIYLAWLLFWQPHIHIEVSEQGVIIVNLLRTHQIPWGQIVRIDTRWALEIFTKSANTPPGPLRPPVATPQCWQAGTRASTFQNPHKLPELFGREIWSIRIQVPRPQESGPPGNKRKIKY